MTNFVRRSFYVYAVETNEVLLASTLEHTNHSSRVIRRTCLDHQPGHVLVSELFLPNLRAVNISERDEYGRVSAAWPRITRQPLSGFSVRKSNSCAQKGGSGRLVADKTIKPTRTCILFCTR